MWATFEGNTFKRILPLKNNSNKKYIMGVYL